MESANVSAVDPDSILLQEESDPLSNSAQTNKESKHPDRPDTVYTRAVLHGDSSLLHLPLEPGKCWSEEFALYSPPDEPNLALKFEVLSEEVDGLACPSFGDTKPVSKNSTTSVVFSCPNQAQNDFITPQAAAANQQATLSTPLSKETPDMDRQIYTHDTFVQNLLIKVLENRITPCLSQRRVSSAPNTSTSRQQAPKRERSVKHSKHKSKDGKPPKPHTETAESKVSPKGLSSGDFQHTSKPKSNFCEKENIAGSSSQTRDVAWEIDLGEFKGKSPKSRKPESAKKSKKTVDSPRSPRPAPVTVETTSVTPGATQDAGESSVMATKSEIQQRKVFDLARWYCISRPQYKRSCGLSSLVSCWNYLFSSLGQGSHRAITQEEALTVLGFSPPFGDIKFGPFTGNRTLMRWFAELNAYYNVRGSCYFLYKPQGKNKTFGITSESGLESVKSALRGTDTAMIYHCYNHYFCPIGYEDTPLRATRAYAGPLREDEVETWVLIGDPSRKQPVIHSKKWEDINADLNNQNPDYSDIRRQWKGPMKLKTKKKGGNLHCIMAFKRSKFQGVMRKGGIAHTKAGGAPVSEFNIFRPMATSDGLHFDDTSSCADSELDTQELMNESDSD